MSTAKVFESIQVGTKTLSHRIVLAPLTRYKSTKKEHVPIVPLMKEYYSQRATRPGTLLITEATFVAEKAGGYDNIPGIWSKDQISHWKEVRKAINAISFSNNSALDYRQRAQQRLVHLPANVGCWESRNTRYPQCRRTPLRLRLPC